MLVRVPCRHTQARKTVLHSLLVPALQRLRGRELVAVFTSGDVWRKWQPGSASSCLLKHVVDAIAARVANKGGDSAGGIEEVCS